jgi:hypothetical protein
MDDRPSFFIHRRKRGRKAEALTSEVVVALVAKSTPNDFKAVRGTAPLENDAVVLMNHNKAIYIGHGCLIIPAIFLVWWYWTKRTARRVVHGVITFTHRSRSSSSMSTPAPMDSITICSDGDNVDVSQYVNGCTTHASSTTTSHLPNESSHYYRSWEDTLPKESSSDDTAKFRFIHWMKRTKTSRTRQTVRTTTLQNLHNNDIQHEMNQKRTEAVQNLPNHSRDEDDTHLRVDSAPKILTQIQTPNNPTHSGIEMFVIEYPQQMSHPAHVTSMI